MERIQFSHLNPSNVIHPEDKQTLDKLQAIPGFETLLKKVVGKYQEVVTDITCTGSHYEINGESYPWLYQKLQEDCKILGCKEVPKMTTQWGYFVSSYSIGGEQQNRIILSSGSVDLLEPEELDFLIGHEIGHIVSGHEPYYMLLRLIYSPIVNSIDSLNLASIIKLPLLDWHRKSHYSADRFGLLCCQDIEVALRTMIKLAGFPKKYFDKINVESFISQANSFEEKNRGKITGMMEKMSQRAASLPWMVYRAKVLYDWYHSDGYREIVQQN